MFFKEDTQTATWAELRVPGWVILRLPRQGDRQWVSGSHSQGLPLCLSSELRAAWTPLPGRTDTWAGGRKCGPASGARRSLPLPPTPPSSSPYPTFWIPLEVTVGRGALSPGEGKVTVAGSTWEGWWACSWGWDEPVSRREAGYSSLGYFFLTQYHFSYGKSEPTYSQDCFKNHSNSYVRGF